VSSAEELYALFLRRRARGEALEFDVFVRERPEAEEALRIIHSLYGRDASLSSLESFAERLKMEMAAPLEAGRERAARDSPEARQAALAGLGAGRRYIVREELARGGMGAILQVWDANLNRALAMKVMLEKGEFGARASPGPSDSQASSRFLEEAQITGQLDHPGVVPVHELGVDEEGRLFFTMRLVKGRELKEVFRLAREQREGWSQTKAAGVLVKVCEALAYAHSKGVIHRDIKPQNIMVGSFGETYLMDWGLAKAAGRKEIHDLRPALPHEVREIGAPPGPEGTPLVTLDGTVLGTPAYMPPEQAQGRIEDVDARSDVYSVGAMLYELLAGRMPYAAPGERTSPLAILEAVRRGPPAPIDELARRAPPELLAICRKAMARAPAERYAGAREMADDLQAYLDNRVVRAYRQGALAEFKKWVARNRGMAGAIAAALLLILILLGAWGLSLQAEKRQILRLSDLKRVADYEAEADRLWPAHPEMVAAIEGWLGGAKELARRLELHRRTLDDLRGRAGGTELEWQHDMLADLVERLAAFADPDSRKGTIASVEARLEFARTVRRRSIEEELESWSRAIASIADPLECPRYGGLEIEPQLGLVPIGRDPDSGLWEFAHLATGAPAMRRTGGRLELREESGLVLVLLPGGAFRMGAKRPAPGEEEGGTNIDPQAKLAEGPVHEVTLEPFFISKYEMTQGQWRHFTGENPSFYDPSRTIGERRHSLLHPVENIDWEIANRVLYQMGLSLPTEAQWEYAARGGTGTVWSTGSEKESLRGAANLADQAAARAGQTWPAINDWPDLDDGYVVHAPVGSYRPNPFGLHDVHGNVWEWCRDLYTEKAYSLPPRPGDGERPLSGSSLRADRGGSYFNLAQNARSAARNPRVPGLRTGELGVRPARGLFKAGRGG
jgi:formylglycine-generating enzyme required for sulfatase activity/serine/threonine protein kinase